MNSQESVEVEELKTKLDSWKYVLLPVNNLLEWEHKYAPILIISFNLLVFGLIWFYNPSILTIVAIIGLVTLLIETAIPFLVSYFVKSNEWNLKSEAKYTRICERLSNFQSHLINFKTKLENTRKERQPLYFLILFFFFVFCAYVGQMVDNLLLTFLAVMFMTLTPGARRHRLVPRTFNKIKRTLGVGNSGRKNHLN
ncbi:ADP-ribosylation factor 6-interacting 1 [Brachionus plicatilis]|uniref:ADP-ribosylation factor 6-interacting 1 n=1 Tax=Brachionus plicatilis TaxID=10195 RepID=A0A3M7QNJ7_BRAPC|nr:ADP-ribosylation factor 6-interacting 1 [Brachionus plicatilis]